MMIWEIFEFMKNRPNAYHYDDFYFWAINSNQVGGINAIPVEVSGIFGPCNIQKLKFNPPMVNIQLYDTCYDYGSEFIELDYFEQLIIQKITSDRKHVLLNIDGGCWGFSLRVLDVEKKIPNKNFPEWLTWPSASKNTNRFKKFIDDHRNI
jgi:hypothetical protein